MRSLLRGIAINIMILLWILVALLGSLARQWNRYVDGDVLPETLLMKGRLSPINIVIAVLSSLTVPLEQIPINIMILEAKMP